MARRGPKLPAPPSPRSSTQPDLEPEPARRPIDDSAADSTVQTLTYLAERLRRLALGLTAALITARAFFPSEPNLKEGAGDGLVWVLLVLVTVGIALAVPLLGGRLRFRWSVDRCVRHRHHGLGRAQRQPTRSIAGRRSTWPGNGSRWAWSTCCCATCPARATSRRSWPARSWPPRWPSRPMASIRTRSSFPCSRPSSSATPTQMLQKLNITPGTRGELMLQGSPPGLDRALVDLRTGQLAGGLSSPARS